MRFVSVTRRPRRQLLLLSICVLTVTLFLVSCGGVYQPRDGAPRGGINVHNIRDAVPKPEPRSRYGNPKSYKVHGRRYYVMADSRGYVERGIASWYGTKFHGRRTSSGETYDMYGMTAAHKELPIPTYVRVVNLRNGQAVVVKVNDRGPFHGNRIIDLSYAAAAKLGILGKGTGLVEVQAIDPRRQAPAPRRYASSYDKDLSLYIQVGAFADRNNADRLRHRLTRSLNGSIRVQQANNGVSPIFRVQVGPLATVEQADQVHMQLARLGIFETHVVIE
jgi:rare lipoprotein A